MDIRSNIHPDVVDWGPEDIGRFHDAGNLTPDQRRELAIAINSRVWGEVDLSEERNVTSLSQPHRRRVETRWPYFDDTPNPDQIEFSNFLAAYPWPFLYDTYACISGLRQSTNPLYSQLDRLTGELRPMIDRFLRIMQQNNTVEPVILRQFRRDMNAMWNPLFGTNGSIRPLAEGNGCPGLRSGIDVTTLIEHLKALRSEYGDRVRVLQVRGVWRLEFDIPAKPFEYRLQTDTGPQMYSFLLGPWTIIWEPSAGFEGLKIRPQPGVINANEGLTHPHELRDNRLCLGEPHDTGSPYSVAQRALKDGRLLDMLTVFEGWAGTYHHAGAATLLEHFAVQAYIREHGRPPLRTLETYDDEPDTVWCDQCECEVDDLWPCTCGENCCEECRHICTVENCRNTYCQRCYSNCARCTEDTCDGCIETCSHCEDNVCVDCMTTNPECTCGCVCNHCSDEPCPHSPVQETQEVSA